MRARTRTRTHTRGLGGVSISFDWTTSLDADWRVVELVETLSFNWRAGTFYKINDAYFTTFPKHRFTHLI